MYLAKTVRCIIGTVSFDFLGTEFNFSNYGNGYSDLVIMSSELYDRFAKINRIDQAIYESEKEIENGAEAVDADIVFAELEKKHFG